VRAAAHERQFRGYRKAPTVPSLKQHEARVFGEYRTQRYVLDAFDRLQRGEVPDLGESRRAC